MLPRELPQSVTIEPRPRPCRGMSALGSARSAVAVLVLALAAALALAPHQAHAQAPQAPAPAQTPPEPPPASIFFDAASLREVLLSPDGRRLALVMGAPGRRVGLYVYTLSDMSKPVTAALFEEADIWGVRWVNAERLVFRIVDRQRGSGSQRYGAGLFSVRADGEELRQLVKISHRTLRFSASRASDPLEFNHVLLSVPRGGGQEVIIGRVDVDAAGDVTAVMPLRLNVVTGRTRQAVSRRPADATRWWFDRDGEPLATLSAVEGRHEVHLRRQGSDEWRLAAQAETGTLPWMPHSFDTQGRMLVVRLNPAGLYELARWDEEARAPEAEPLVSTPGFDFHGVPFWSPDGETMLGVWVTTDGGQAVWFDPARRQLQAHVDARLPGLQNRVSCLRCGRDDQVALVFSSSPAEPGRWFLLRGAEPQWTEIGRARRQVDPRQAARVEFHRIAARDGHDLPVWLTIPADHRPGQARPAVVLVHGGPWVRGGHWEWSDMEQFLASRGYVVINAEFRGSTGYGMAHFRAGWRQWGRAMQDDVADALQWAVHKGWADPKRACIAGASYGGYAALMGLVRHPELYRCAAAWVSVTDPLLLFKPVARDLVTQEMREHGMPRMIGDPQRDAEMLREVSPLAQASRLTQPLLLAFSVEDRVVPPMHGQQLLGALRALGREPEYVEYEGEGHQWLKAQTRVDFAQRLERFLARHLGP